MKKMIKLNDLKVSSFVTNMNARMSDVLSGGVTDGTGDCSHCCPTIITVTD